MNEEVNSELELVIDTINLIEQHENYFSGDKPEAFIVKAEEALNVKLPMSYKFFLKKMGCGNIYGLEIYGIVSDDFINSGIPDGIWLTLSNREDGFPHKLVTVAEDGMGGSYALDTSKLVAEECPVILCDVFGNIIETFAGFGSFLNTMVKEAIEIQEEEEMEDGE
jgi:hypothetical protein